MLAYAEKYIIFMIFKGNLGEFIAKYKIKYPDGCKVDSNGKIILEH